MVERDIYEVANQLQGYVDEGTPEKLATFLMREGVEAAKLAGIIVNLRAELEQVKRERDEARKDAAFFRQQFDDQVESREAAERLAGARVTALEWTEGTYTSTDDDGGPMEGVPYKLYAWRSGPYIIIRQRGEDGLFILRGKSDGVGLIVPTLEAAKAPAQADYERRILSALASHPCEPNPVVSHETANVRDKPDMQRIDDALVSCAGLIRTLCRDNIGDTAASELEYVCQSISALAEPAGEAHPDDVAVDRFATAMKAKLGRKREEGRGGWDNREECSAEHLSYLLIQHCLKGDPLDVGNLAMMLHQRGDRIVIDDETASIMRRPEPAGEAEPTTLTHEPMEWTGEGPYGFSPVTPPDASAIRDCATEGCDRPATVRFERGNVGSYYCHGCYMRVQALAGSAE